MVEDTQIPTETLPELIARSLFGFILLAFIPALITWIAFLLSPISPDVTFAKIRIGIIIGFGVFVLVLLWLLIQSFRTPIENMHNIASHIVNILSRRWLAIGLIFVLLELILFSFIALSDVAPAITNPSKFLLVCWSLILLALILTIHWQGLSGWMEKSRHIWMGVGIMIVGIAAIFGLYIATNYIVQFTGIENKLRGGLDYRPLHFYDDGEPIPSAQDFWSEQSQTIVQWLPFAYWHVSSIDGEYINVDESGLRYTPDYVAEDVGANTIGFFGGSTVWGEGARDAYTIPGHTARLLHENYQAQHVINYGQTGFVSTQDMILFQQQILQGDAPDVAVFYQGFNDVLASLIQGYTGVTLQEDMRIADVEAGRSLRAGQPVFRLPIARLEDYDLSLAGVEPTTAENIANRWFANVDMIQTVADGYRIDVLFVWQPMITEKQSTTESEQGIITRMDETYPGIIELYDEVNSIVLGRIEQESRDDIIVLSDLFADDEREIFYDLVHITELGNLTVAEAILPHIIPLLE